MKRRLKFGLASSPVEFMVWSPTSTVTNKGTPPVDFSPTELQKLGQFPIVPTRDGNALRWLPPRQCYFGGDAKDQFHSKLFVFVDFGNPANTFLSACGTKREPSVEEVAQILVADPVKFYKLTQNPQQ